MGAMHTYSAHGGAVCKYFTFGKKDKEFKYQLLMFIMLYISF